MRTDGRLALRTHVYWVDKEKFQYDVDTYAVWTAFVAERGAFAFRIRDMAGEASFGDLVLCPPHTPFHRKVLRALTFHFYQFEWAGADPLPYGLIRLKDTARLSSTLAYLKQYSGASQLPSAAAGKQHYLADLLLMMETERMMEDSGEWRGKAPQDPLMWEAKLWLERRYAEPLNLRQLADALGVSPVQLTRRFRRLHGVTPIGYLTNLRLQKAAQLLLDTDLTLDRIAKECGYENGFYLSRVFSKRMGMSPSLYREAYKV